MTQYAAQRACAVGISTDRTCIDAAGEGTRPALAGLFGVLLALSTLKCNLVSVPAWWLGQAALGTVFALSLAGLLASVCLWGHYPAWRKSAIGYAWGMLIAIYLVGMMHGLPESMYYKILQLILVFALFAYASSCFWNSKAVCFFAASYSLALAAAWMPLAILTSGSPLRLPTNSNAIGYLSLMQLSICFLGYAVNKARLSRAFFIILGVYYVTLWLTSYSRAAWMAGAVFTGSYLALSYLPGRRVWLNIGFICALAVIGISIRMNTSRWREKLSIEQEVTDVNSAIVDKPMTSREKVWMPVINILGEHPWMGMGVGESRQDLVADAQPSHSGYFDIGIQTGIPGMVAFLLVLYSIGYACCRATADRRYGCIGCALLLAITLHEGYETTLLENILPIGVTVWMMLGLCLNLHLRQNMQHNNGRCVAPVHSPGAKR